MQASTADFNIPLSPKQGEVGLVVVGDEVSVTVEGLKVGDDVSPGNVGLLVVGGEDVGLAVEALIVGGDVFPGKFGLVVVGGEVVGLAVEGLIVGGNVTLGKVGLDNIDDWLLSAFALAVFALSGCFV